jgi:uncharacterized protein DUF1326
MSCRRRQYFSSASTSYSGIIRGIQRLGIALAISLQTNSGIAQSPVVAKTNSYKVTGVWSDACPCKIACPCWSTNHSQAKYCVNVQVFSLSGQLEGRTLNHSILALLNYPAKAFEAPQPYLLYADADTTPELQEAIIRLFANEYHLSPSQGLRLAALNSSFSPASQKVNIPGILKYDVTAPSSLSARRLDSDVRDHLYSWLYDSEQWSVRNLTLKLGRKKISYKGTNSIAAKVAYSRLLDTNLDQAGNVSDSDATVNPATHKHSVYERSSICTHPARSDEHLEPKR